MLILCPNCRRKSRVKSPPSSITALKVRCAVCKHIFVPAATDLEEEASGPVATATESGFRQTTKSVDVSEFVRQSVVGSSVLRGQNTDISGVGKRPTGATFSTNPSLVGSPLRVKTDISLTAPSEAPRAIASSVGGMSPRVVASTPPPAPVVAPPAQGAPQTKENSEALAGASSAAPRSRRALFVSTAAATMLGISLVLAVWVVPRLPGWSQVGRWAPDPAVSAASEVAGVTLTGAQFISWGANAGPPILVVLGSARATGLEKVERPDVLLRLLNAHGEVKKEARVPLGVSVDLIDVVRESISEAAVVDPAWLRTRAATLGPLEGAREVGFRVALTLPSDSPEQYRRELRLVAREAQPSSK